jgi:hypothetical protein
MFVYFILVFLRTGLNSIPIKVKAYSLKFIFIEHNNSTDSVSHLSHLINIDGGGQKGQKIFVGIGSTIINNLIITNDLIIGTASTELNSIRISEIYLGPTEKQLIKL